jgi:hypothetical protein
MILIYASSDFIAYCKESGFIVIKPLVPSTPFCNGDHNFVGLPFAIKDRVNYITG